MKKLLLFITLLTVSGITISQEDDVTNKIALMPFHYLVNDNAGSEEQVYQIQSDAYSMLMKKNSGLIVQDPEDTNVKLFRAGITLENVRGYTSEELCQTLGVEYLISGTINQHKKQVSTSSSYTTVKETNSSSNSKGKSSGNEGISSSSSSSTYTSDDYTTKLTLKLHNNKGESLYSDSHTSVWSGPEAYKNAFRFLWKKTPLYKK